MWKLVVGFEDRYEVSDDGRVRSLFRAGFKGKQGGHTMKLRRDEWGYMRVTLSGGLGHKVRTVHRLVLEAFAGPCPDGMQACHNNGNPQDNRISNLRWDTASENMRDRTRHGRFIKHSDRSVRKIAALKKIGHTHAAVAKEVGCSPGYVTKIMRGELRQTAFE